MLSPTINLQAAVMGSRCAKTYLQGAVPNYNMKHPSCLAWALLFCKGSLDILTKAIYQYSPCVSNKS